MKKRILALALAGTTAFSVFGAAMSANAASSHVVYGNDPYTSYKSATVSYTEGSGWYNTITKKFVKEAPTLTLAEAIEANTAAALAEAGYEAPEAGTHIYKHEIYTGDYTKNDDLIPAESFLSTSDVPTDKTTDKVTVYNSWDELLADNRGVTNVYVNPGKDYYTNRGRVYTNLDLADVVEAYVKNTEAISNTVKDYVKEQSTSSVSVDPRYAYKYTYAYGDGALVVDELSRDGVTVENGNVYAYDFYTAGASVASFAEAWNTAKFVRATDYKSLNSTGDVTALIRVIKNIETYDYGTSNGELTEADAIDGRGGYYDPRADVIAEYEDFLVEIGLATYTWNGELTDRGTPSKADFLDMYAYKYNGVDEYNFEGLVSDLYDSMEEDQDDGYYTNLSSSHLVYLMQQYDKYVDGSYIEEESLGESRWAELLISAIEAVDDTNFRGSSYNSFKRAADMWVNAYESATTPAQQKKAIEGLYAVVAKSSYGPTSGADKTDLAASLNALYFNNKTIPSVYMEGVEYNSNNAELVLYAYSGYNELLDSLMAPHFAYYKASTDSIKAVYPLYPAYDYSVLGSTYGAEYAGITGEVPNGVTAEYEWFANVYQLAATINSKANNTSYQGIIDTVNEALNEAVADLTAATSPKNSASMRLEEAVEDNEAAVKEEADYIAKYYNAYAKGVEYAENAEGAMQTAYAIEIAITSGEALSYQSTQTTVTKGMIADLKTAISDGTKALTALKNEKDNYNAAQVLALTKAIDSAQGIVNSYNGVSASKINHVATATAGDKDGFVISDVNAAIAAIDDAIAYKNVIQGWSKNDNGKYQYGEGNEYFQDGWKQIGATWYYFEKGEAVQSDWRKIDGKWYFLNSDCGAATGWKKVDGTWYYFDRSCAMKTGWLQTDGNWYYLKPSGAMATGWQTINGKSYYFSEKDNEYGGFALGQMLYNTTTPDGYKVGADGAWVK